MLPEPTEGLSQDRLGPSHRPPHTSLAALPFSLSLPSLARNPCSQPHTTHSVTAKLNMRLGSLTLCLESLSFKLPVCGILAGVYSTTLDHIISGACLIDWLSACQQLASFRRLVTSLHTSSGSTYTLSSRSNSTQTNTHS